MEVLDRLRKQGKLATKEDIARFGGQKPLQVGTEVIVTHTQTTRMIQERISPREPYHGVIVSVLLVAAAYEILRDNGFVEPYVPFTIVKIQTENII